jgi:hypothetical protein
MGRWGSHQPPGCGGNTKRLGRRMHGDAPATRRFWKSGRRQRKLATQLRRQWRPVPRRRQAPPPKPCPKWPRPSKPCPKWPPPLGGDAVAVAVAVVGRFESRMHSKVHQQPAAWPPNPKDRNQRSVPGERAERQGRGIFGVVGMAGGHITAVASQLGGAF